MAQLQHLPVPCAVSSPTPAVQQIVAEESTQDLPCCCLFDIGFDTWWEQQCEVLRVGDRHYEGQLRVLHSHENPDDFRSGVWIPTHCFQPNGKRVCTRRRTGCENMIPRPPGVVKRRGSGALYKYWAQERGPHFGPACYRVAVCSSTPRRGLEKSLRHVGTITLLSLLYLPLENMSFFFLP